MYIEVTKQQQQQEKERKNTSANFVLTDRDQDHRIINNSISLLDNSVIECTSNIQTLILDDLVICFSSVFFLAFRVNANR